jgi:hypothetical protein
MQLADVLFSKSSFQQETDVQPENTQVLVFFVDNATKSAKRAKKKEQAYTYAHLFL